MLTKDCLGFESFAFLSNIIDLIAQRRKNIVDVIFANVDKKSRKYGRIGLKFLNFLSNVINCKAQKISLLVKKSSETMVALALNYSTFYPM